MIGLKTAAALLAAVTLAACATAQTAEPAATASERNPLDLRRTTLVVRDMETSLAFYRDALGMEVQYDQELTSPNLGRRGGDGVNRSRLVLLRANDGFIGMLGLWQFLDQSEYDAAPPSEPGFVPGDIVLLFNHRNLEEIFPDAAAVPGVQVLGEPRERVYPSANGDIYVMVSMLVDPDGHIVELNRVISGVPVPE